MSELGLQEPGRKLARAVCRREDIKEGLAGIGDGQLDQLLTSLGARGLAKIYRDRHGVIALANATYKGLKEAKPLEYYKWFPGWIKKGLLF